MWSRWSAHGPVFIHKKLTHYIHIGMAAFSRSQSKTPRLFFLSLSTIWDFWFTTRTHCLHITSYCIYFSFMLHFRFIFAFCWRAIRRDTFSEYFVLNTRQPTTTKFFYFQRKRIKKSVRKKARKKGNLCQFVKNGRFLVRYICDVSPMAAVEQKSYSSTLQQQHAWRQSNIALWQPS